MRIIVFGATGKTGMHTWRKALQQGHQVTAFGRSVDRLSETEPELRIFKGEVLDLSEVTDLRRPCRSQTSWRPYRFGGRLYTSTRPAISPSCAPSTSASHAFTSRRNSDSPALCVLLNTCDCTFSWTMILSRILIEGPDRGVAVRSLPL